MRNLFKKTLLANWNLKMEIHSYIPAFGHRFVRSIGYCQCIFVKVLERLQSRVCHYYCQLLVLYRFSLAYNDESSCEEAALGARVEVDGEGEWHGICDQDIPPTHSPTWGLGNLAHLRLPVPQEDGKRSPLSYLTTDAILLPLDHKGRLPSWAPHMDRRWAAGLELDHGP